MDGGWEESKPEKVGERVLKCLVYFGEDRGLNPIGRVERGPTRSSNFSKLDNDILMKIQGDKESLFLLNELTG